MGEAFLWFGIGLLIGFLNKVLRGSKNGNK
jgi:hypothetical protein